ncbi:MAG: TRAP transporter large permease [Syntrophothermus sp.]
MTGVLFGTFAGLVLLNVPIAISLGLATVIALAVSGTAPMVVVAQRMFTATDSFPLMAIPFFMIAGSLMERGGISRRLINLANTMVGTLPGGLALVAVLASMFFAAISGSGPATVAAIGSIMIPAMARQGYDRGFATAVQASGGFIGVIIPPSIPMITYGVVAGASIGGLFLGGFIPGILMGIALMIVAYIISKKRNYIGVERATFKQVAVAFKESLLALLMPVIILGGIYGGIFTPTEAGNVAVVYGLIVGIFVYKELKWQDLRAVFRTSAINTSIVMLIIATASAFGLLLTRQMIPVQIAEFFLSLTKSPYVLLLLINILLLIVGTFMETNAAIIILAPIFLPIITRMGIDPIHFGLIMVVNLAIGMITPPLGVNLFVGCGIAQITIERLVKAIWPFLLASIVVLFLITYIPGLVMWLPKLFMP